MAYNKASNQQQRFSFPGYNGETLAARLDLPVGPVRGYALLAHCFTCSKDIQAARRIAQRMALEGLGVVRFDFTGLGSSSGDFANTNFTSNVQDLMAAVAHMRTHLEAPAILVGHSLGGAAVLAAAGDIAEVKAVATIGAPSDVAHVLQNLGASLETVEAQGKADVVLGGRTFTLKREFVDDARGFRLSARIADLRKPLLILHAPRDATVGIDNASEIFMAAKHPKSFVSLDNADHLLSDPADGDFAASIIAAWASRYLNGQGADEAEGHASEQPPALSGQGSSVNELTGVVVSETGLGKFQNAVVSRQHRLIADEPASVGGLDSGPSPYDFVSIALASCTSMTLRMYADRKAWEVGRISVSVTHGKVPAAHCQDCGDIIEASVSAGQQADGSGKTSRIDRFERTLHIEGEVSDDMAAKLLEIADKCPVHKTLQTGAAVVTKMKGAGQNPL
ncbi:MAG: bifunctional alpha/beta hydrolase/OsmC family protein [Pseudomonadota bacterium]